jgi:hypothetical protein
MYSPDNTIIYKIKYDPIERAFATGIYSSDGTGTLGK